MSPDCAVDAGSLKRERGEQFFGVGEGVSPLLTTTNATDKH
jgi:hypothetical protein